LRENFVGRTTSNSSSGASSYSSLEMVFVAARLQLGSKTAIDLAVAPHNGLRAGNVPRGTIMRVIVALVLAMLVATSVASAWLIWIIVWLGSPTEIDFAVVASRSGARRQCPPGKRHAGVFALVLGILATTTVASAWGLWAVVTS
jgi:hypothetical protein